MAEISFNQVYDGVTLALHRAFPSARIHGGVVKQDLKDGDFNVLPITANHTEQMGARSQRKSVFDVIYYASKCGGRGECLQVADVLPMVLRTIQTPNGDLVHCSFFEITPEDDVLHCMVVYTHFIYESNAEEAGDAMEKLIIL